MPQDLDYLTVSRIVLRARRPDRCPHCDYRHFARIAYGFFATAEPGESDSDIVAGGCVITTDSPHWQCKGCGRGIFDNGLSAAIARELQIQTQAKELDRGAVSEVNDGLFDAFSGAREFAVSKARDSGGTVSVERWEDGWRVCLVEHEEQNMEDRHTDESEMEFSDWYGRWSEDLDDDDLGVYESEMDEIYSEIGDYSTCLVRSEEEGWFYDDENEDEAMRSEMQRKDDEERRQYFGY